MTHWHKKGLNPHPSDNEVWAQRSYVSLSFLTFLVFTFSSSKTCYSYLCLQAQTAAAVAEKEDEVDAADREYTDLQKALAESLDLLEQEMKKVKKFQRQLDDGKMVD